MASFNDGFSDDDERLDALAFALAEDIYLETGKPIWETLKEVDALADKQVSP